MSNLLDTILDQLSRSVTVGPNGEISCTECGWTAKDVILFGSPTGPMPFTDLTRRFLDHWGDGSIFTNNCEQFNERKVTTG